MTTLETRRQLLEGLEIIEDAISQRFGRNPELYYSNITKQVLIDGGIELPSTTAMAVNRIYKSKRTKRSRKQLVTQQHEINLFLSQALDKQKELSGVNGTVDVEDYRDEEINFDKFREAVDQINSKYEDQEGLALDINENIVNHEMFSATFSKSTILSESARDLDLNQIFTRDEQYGDLLDLEKFHSQWLNVIKRADCSYLQFFDVLQKFLDPSEYLLSPPMDRKNERYGQFLIELFQYVEQFFAKVYVLVNSTILSQRMESDFEEYLRMPIYKSNHGLYCVACGKWFKTPTVFQSHLTGKHHRNNRDKRFTKLQAEYKLHRYLKILQGQLERTRGFVERKMAFTTEERMEEMSRLARIYEGPDYAPDEKEIEEKEDSVDTPSEKKMNGGIELPLGLDGLPIPLWLYKLQGLDVTYSCEICGNQTYRGRRMFERHFTEPTHLFHLKCLGIEASDAFRSITSIEEAQNLWKRISGNNTTSSRDIEVEDEEGNVMTQQVYEELKKQGLV
ncbi:hypothetical protein ZYGR_0H00410 [Zygosaccharomyces rouxii]|uniref:ZYRO0B04950p n=2 Tax=Zygosaccharomyces rouxii TaxID=4956 RepID=C5DR22_ZYGRC|nr:uncharacterized protein ZYRO0B04950g [Zygosaccharomyces rouxii]KAH9200221.1 hypothetical protein LQ764DRAFT_234713 [Zygosaccharomyces rouxii]GAV47200.1 hypothetical protein ZYGR_0H00410 [Zygosaccharomyces rouxii]CAR26233.1 ZYRO0B04950p [Zygosaccharomyces rouxii]